MRGHAQANLVFNHELDCRNMAEGRKGDDVIASNLGGPR